MENHENNIKILDDKIFELDIRLNRSVGKEDKLIPEDSVESLLGLGFINDLDVLDSLEFTDEVKKLESVLAKLLFQIRLGVPLADEKNVSRALEYVSSVIDELEMTKITLLKKSKKSV